MPRRSTKRKPARPPRTVKRDISAAVDLFSERIKNELEEAAQPPFRPIRHSPAHKRVMWLGVIIVGCAVFAMWGLNAWTLWQDMRSQENSYGLFSEAGEDLDAIFGRFTSGEASGELFGAIEKEAQAQREKEALQETIRTEQARAALSQVLGSVVTASTTTSTETR